MANKTRVCVVDAAASSARVVGQRVSSCDFGEPQSQLAKATTREADCRIGTNHNTRNNNCDLKYFDTKVIVTVIVLLAASCVSFTNCHAIRITNQLANNKFNHHHHHNYRAIASVPITQQIQQQQDHQLTAANKQQSTDPMDSVADSSSFNAHESDENGDCFDSIKPDTSLYEMPAQFVNIRQAENNRLMQSEREQLDAMLERRQSVASNNQHEDHTTNTNNNQHEPLGSSQELSPISIGLEPPFSMPPFPIAGPPQHPKQPQMVNVDNIDQGAGPTLPFGLNPLPHLLGFHNSPFDGPQRGDQSAHSNHHAAAPPGGANADQDSGGPESAGVVGVPGPGGASGGGGKVWPKIFRFTDGRINLSDFEKQKKIRLSNKNQHGGDNQIESAPIMFDGRQLKRKSFLILHGGIFS